MIEPVGIRGDDETYEERGKQMPKYIGNKFLQNRTPPFYGRIVLLYHTFEERVFWHGDV